MWSMLYSSRSFEGLTEAPSDDRATSYGKQRNGTWNQGSEDY